MKQEEIRIVGKGLTKQEIVKLLFFVAIRLKKDIICVGVRHHG